LLAFAVLLGAACNRAPKNVEAIRQGVVDHLQKNTGLDMSAMTVEVTNVTYRGNEADAMVAFKPKNSPEGGMSMSYTLENENGRWLVKKRAGSGGMGANPHAGGPPASGTGATSQGNETQLPPGHPPTTGGTASGQSGQPQLPAGHPPVDAAKPKTGGSTKSGSNAAKK
jgi:hypothetical protein